MARVEGVEPQNPRLPHQPRDWDLHSPFSSGLWYYEPFQALQDWIHWLLLGRHDRLHAIMRLGAVEEPAVDLLPPQDLARPFPAVRAYCGGQFRDLLVVGGLVGSEEHSILVKYSEHHGWAFTVVKVAAATIFTLPFMTS